MDKDLLKKLIYWISNHEFSSYTSEDIARDLKIDIENLSTAFLVIEAILFTTLSTAQTKTNIEHPSTEDDFFELMLTFFEELSDYKVPFAKIFNVQKISPDYFSLLPIINKLVINFFHSYIQTFLDKITYNILFLKIFHVWLTDTTEDLSRTSHQINHITKIIYQPS